MGEGSGFETVYRDDGTTSYEETHVPLHPAPPPTDTFQWKFKSNAMVVDVGQVTRDSGFDINDDNYTDDGPEKVTGRKVKCATFANIAAFI